MVLEPMFPARPLAGPLSANMAANFAGSDVMSRLLHAYRGLAMAGPFGPGVGPMPGVGGLPPPPPHPAARGPPVLLRGIPQPQPHPGSIGHHPGQPGHPPLSPPGMRTFGSERPDPRTSPNCMPMTPTSRRDEAASPGAGESHLSVGDLVVAKGDQEGSELPEAGNIQPRHTGVARAASLTLRARQILLGRAEKSSRKQAEMQ